MNLIKTSFLTAVSTVVKIITGFIVNKVVAIYIGPSGMALTGQFGNFVTMALSFSNGGINNGIVKYVAEYNDDSEKRSRILSSSILISLLCSLILSVVIMLFYRNLSVFLLKSEEYGSIFIVFGATLVIFSLNSSLISILNGYKEIKKFVTLNIISSIIGLLITSFLVVMFRLYGSLLSIVVSQTLLFFVTIFFIVKSEWFKLNNFTQGIERDSFIKLSKFTVMALLSAMTLPISQIIVRNYITDHISLNAAGQWQGVWKISDVYLMIITTSISVYYLPRLSEIIDKDELRREIRNGYKILMPIVIVLATMIYLSREAIIHILFTKAFLPMSELFAFQLIGDFFKIASWLLAFLMVAKAMTKLFIITEIGFTASYVIFSMLFINRFGLIGVTYAFALNYFLYLLTMVYLFRDTVFPGSSGFNAT
ncbi:MAG: O-antigen translocase [Desulfomonilia bacterium]